LAIEIGVLAMSVEHWSDSVILAELSDDPQFTDDLSAIVELCSRDARQDVLLSFAGVNYLNSSNIAQLLKLRKLVTTTNQRRLKFAGVTNQVWGVFLVTGLDRIFDFVEDVPSGLASLQMGD
jgi:anti-anti-sigma regulatory factor